MDYRGRKGNLADVCMCVTRSSLNQNIHIFK